MKYIILSVNEDPQYKFYVPLTCWAWRKIGWEPIVMGDEFYPLSPLEGYRSDTIAQVSRLYGACLVKDDDIVMTGDIDMIPLSNYWNPQRNLITIYGHDLTNYQNFPICYIAMTKTRWVEVMGLTSNDYMALIKRDLDTLPQAKSQDFYKYWETDQDLITQRIKAVNFDKGFIDRGRYKNGIAKGRVDRGAWSLEHDEFIDAHLHRDLYKVWNEPENPLWQKKWTEHIELMRKIWPDDEYDRFFTRYAKDYEQEHENPFGV